ncbi:MAG: ABC transporter substrate-binding protein [Candidatus Thorarchaeota archaeon]
MRRPLAFLTVGFLLYLMTANTAISAGTITQGSPPGYFQLTLIVPSNNPVRVQHVTAIANELWKIGIQADTMLISWEPFLSRVFESVNFDSSAGDGFDIGFIGRMPGNSFLLPSLISQYYHSNRIDKVAGDNNWYPINHSRLDELCDLIDTERNFEERRKWVHEALKIILWDVHPVMGIYQPANVYALDYRLRYFDAFRWGLPNIHVQELSYKDDQTVFRYASPARFTDLNPALSESFYDSLIYQPTQAGTYHRDARMILQPVLATSDPIRIGSNETVASSIDLATISPDSPYADTTAVTTWGPNPAVDTAQFNPYKTAADRSMFLINIRTDVPWQPGWGYSLGQRNVTVEDFQWTLGYWLNNELSSPDAQTFKDLYGNDPTQAIQKINATMFKLNLRGRLGNGQVADWFEACALTPLPRHVLDPTFDATPYGGEVGVTPDGTKIAVYNAHRGYAYNTGAKPPLGAGPYSFESWNETTISATLKKFDQWGGYGTNSLWNDSRYSESNIGTYIVAVYPSKESATAALEDGEIDGIDGQFGLHVSYNPWEPWNISSQCQFLTVESNSIEYMGYNTRHPVLSDRYVRLAISHMVPAQRIVDFILGGFGSVNELVGIALANPYKPNEEEFKLMGLDVSENVVDPQTGETLEFQGHIRYNINKAWALMEKAGYNMDPFRYSLYAEWAPTSYYDDGYSDDYAVSESPQWGLRPGDTVSWKFQKCEFPFDPVSGNGPSEQVLVSTESGPEYDAVPLSQGSVISIAVEGTSQSLWVQKQVDGIKGVTERLKGPYVVPVNLDWMDHWFTEEWKVEQDDTKIFRVAIYRPWANLKHQMEYDKIDGTLRQLELKGNLDNQSIHVLLIRTDLIEDDYFNLFFSDITTSNPVLIIVAVLGGGAAGIGLAHALRMWQRSI